MRNFKQRALMLTALAMLLPACSTQPTPQPSSGVIPSLIPPLTQTSRQPPPPSECVPTCSGNLAADPSFSQALPMPPARPASSASATTTR